MEWPAGLFEGIQVMPETTLTVSPRDDARTKAAMVAYQDAMRRCQTWRHAIRAALAAADAVDPLRVKETP